MLIAGSTKLYGKKRRTYVAVKAVRISMRESDPQENMKVL